MTIQDLTSKYRGRIDYLDMEILIAHSLGKTREFVLMYPEYSITKIQNTKINKYIRRRMSGEPIAYILKHKEFFGLDFIVNKDTLVPRPETELMVEQALSSVIRHQASDEKITVIDVGTGSGCIITALAHGTKDNGHTFFATDISKGALRIAKKNAKIHSLDKKIKFLHGSLLSPLIENCKFLPQDYPVGEKIVNSRMIILANLPYLSKEIYSSAPVDVKKFEPKSALYSPEQGLQYYRKLLEQIKELLISNDELQITAFFEISPEQKTSLTKIIKVIFPFAKIEFSKDLAGKWRICKITY